jgi:hypothetical protein
MPPSVNHAGVVLGENRFVPSYPHSAEPELADGLPGMAFRRSGRGQEIHK